MNRLFHLFTLCTALVAAACGSDKETDTPPPAPDALTLTDVRIGTQSNLFSFTDVDPEAQITMEFSTRLDKNTIENNISLKDASGEVFPAQYAYDSERTIIVTPTDAFKSYGSYSLGILPGLSSDKGSKIASEKVIYITAGLNMSDKFERIPDEELLTLVQRQTFRYFWEFGHPNSGLARERTTSGDVVTTGGSGFGIIGMVIAAERGFITRAEALERIQKITAFLSKADRFHGALPHWYNGRTGAVQPFSADDNGADLVETAFMMEGLLTARAYFDGADAAETALREEITALWEAVEWDFFTKEGTEKLLYWHWSPDKGWKMNMAIKGWNECLLVYVLGASSPTHPISKEVYDNGWAQNGGFRNGQTFYDVTLPLGEDLGGPLFFSHYSFLGLCPKGLSDAYADYWEQNRAHSLINYRYCVANPKKFAGYSADCWGLTASDGNNGYGAWSPSNDTGVIAPTAAISAMPYTPEESMAALRFFYYKLGDKLWGDYGFIDAFNLSEIWFAKGSHLAIDQGAMLVMIENHRTGLPWSLFMSDADVRHGLQTLGFNVQN